MGQILKRFGIYLLALAALFTLFNLWPPLPPSGVSGARLGYYVGLCVGFGVGALCFEFTYRVFRWKVNWVERRRSIESKQIKLKQKSRATNPAPCLG
jgi:hypothetical protein